MRAGDADLYLITNLGIPQSENPLIGDARFKVQKDPGLEAGGLHPGNSRGHADDMDLPDLGHHAGKPPFAQARIVLESLGRLNHIFTTGFFPPQAHRPGRKDREDGQGDKEENND